MKIRRRGATGHDDFAEQAVAGQQFQSSCAARGEHQRHGDRTGRGDGREVRRIENQIVAIADTSACHRELAETSAGRKQRDATAFGPERHTVRRRVGGREHGRRAAGLQVDGAVAGHQPQRRVERAVARLGGVGGARVVDERTVGIAQAVAAAEKLADRSATDRGIAAQIDHGAGPVAQDVGEQSAGINAGVYTAADIQLQRAAAKLARRAARDIAAAGDHEIEGVVGVRPWRTVVSHIPVAGGAGVAAGGDADIAAAEGADTGETAEIDAPGSRLAGRRVTLTPQPAGRIAAIGATISIFDPIAAQIALDGQAEIAAVIGEVHALGVRRRLVIGIGTGHLRAGGVDAVQRVLLEIAAGPQVERASASAEHRGDFQAGVGVGFDRRIQHQASVAGAAGAQHRRGCKRALIGGGEIGAGNQPQRGAQCARCLHRGASRRAGLAGDARDAGRERRGDDRQRDAAVYGEFRQVERGTGLDSISWIIWATTTEVKSPLVGRGIWHDPIGGHVVLSTIVVTYVTACTVRFECRRNIDNTIIDIRRSGDARRADKSVGNTALDGKRAGGADRQRHRFAGSIGGRTCITVGIGTVAIARQIEIAIGGEIAG